VTKSGDSERIDRLEDAIGHLHTILQRALGSSAHAIDPTWTNAEVALYAFHRAVTSEREGTPD